MATVGAGVLVACPDGRQFGHLALELLMALTEARARRATLWLVPPPHPVNPALLEVESPDVRIVRWPAVARPVVRARLAIAGLPRAARFARDAMIEAVFDQAARDVTFHIERSPIPETLRRHLRTMKQALGHRTRRPMPAPSPLYFRRRLIRDPLPTALRGDVLRRAEALARAAGIPLDTPLATVHAREPGYKLHGREVHQKAQMQATTKGYRDDSLRNARIETYGPAIDLLVSRGYTVVRIGDPSMTPIRRDGLLDLATSPANDPLLQVYCLFRSRVLISGESGPSAASYLAGAALLTVNATDPIGSYPVRGSNLFLLKHVIDRAGGPLRPSDLLDEAYLSAIRSPDRFGYRDNTPEEILQATYEILGRLDGQPDTPAQVRFRDAATLAADRLKRQLGYVRKWGADDGFLGDGALVRFQAEES